MIGKEEIATVAYKGAIGIRALAKVPRLDPLNVFDVAQQLKVEVRFILGGTIEGLYEADRRIILVPVDRPAGRRVFACAHELAHWRYKHGSMLDDTTTIEAYGEKPEERLADMLAGYLLMFPPAVEHARTTMGLDYATCGEKEIYALGSWFGVSYASILGHLRWVLRKLSHDRYEALRRVAPKAIRARLLPGIDSQHLVVMKAVAPRTPLDLEQGDHALLPPKVVAKGGSVAVVESTPEHTVVEALQPGITLLQASGRPWAASARVMRRGYTGRAVFRNLEPCEDE